MDTKPESNRDPLRELLSQSRAHPPLASNFQAAVWRRIERNETAATAIAPVGGWLERWIEMLLLPRIALASLAFLLVMGGITGMVTTTNGAREQAQARYLSAVAPNTIR